MAISADNNSSLGILKNQSSLEILNSRQPWIPKDSGNLGFFKSKDNLGILTSWMVTATRSLKGMMMDRSNCHQRVHSSTPLVRFAATDSWEDRQAGVADEVHGVGDGIGRDSRGISRDSRCNRQGWLMGKAGAADGIGKG